MNERKILLFILSVIFYCLYSVHMWFMKENVQENNTAEIPNVVVGSPEIPQMVTDNKTKIRIKKVKPKSIPLYVKNACSILEVFTTKPEKVTEKNKMPNMEGDNNTVTVLGITVFLVILVVNALLDVMKVKEEERARRKLNPDGERRQSLAEFANKKTLRRESSKFGLQLFQIAESFVNGDEEKNKRRESRITRGESTTSYFSEKKTHSEGSAPASIAESSTSANEPRLVKRQSVAKMIGARPVPMVRRSSFPALPLNPEVQALMLGHRQSSFDSDDEGDGRGRRVRIIRRY